MCGRGTLHDIIGSRKLTKLTLLDLLDFLFPHTPSPLSHPFFLGRVARSPSYLYVLHLQLLRRLSSPITFKMAFRWYVTWEKRWRTVSWERGQC